MRHDCQCAVPGDIACSVELLYFYDGLFSADHALRPHHPCTRRLTPTTCFHVRCIDEILAAVAHVHYSRNNQMRLDKLPGHFGMLQPQAASVD